MACEMGFWDMLDAMAPEARERFLREQAAQFACEVPEGAESAADAPSLKDEPKDLSKP